MHLLAFNNVEEKFASSAATIALHNFHWHYPTLVLFNCTLIFSVDIFLRSYQKNVYVGFGTFYPGYVQRIRQFVIFGADLSDIAHMLTWMRKHQFDNTGKFIVVCQSERSDDCDEDSLIDMLWNYKIVNVVVINTRKENTVNEFTYDSPEDCIIPRLIPVKRLPSCLSYGHGHCHDLFPLKLKNLHRCPIIVSTFNQVPYMNLSNDKPTGADGDLLCVIADAMNFTLVMMTPRIGFGWGKVEDNGTWTGSLADVYHDWANFSMTSASITLSRFTTFQMSTDYSMGAVAWVTHPSKEQPASLKLLRPFQLDVQIALCVSFATVVLLKVFVKSDFLSSVRQKLNVTISYDILFHSWALCLGLPVTTFPTNKALLCLSVFWMWYCMLIRTLYQACLINSLKTEVYEPDINTLEEAIALSYSFGGGLALRDFYIENPVVYDGWQNVESVDIVPTMIKLSKGLKFVLAMNMETAYIFMNTNPDKRLHILPQVIMLTPVKIFFKKYSPLVKPLDIVLSRLRECGIIQKISNDNSGIKNVDEDTGDNTPLSMVHYTGCYAILLTGWIMSTLCFIAEILYHLKIKRHKMAQQN